MGTGDGGTSAKDRRTERAARRAADVDAPVRPRVRRHPHSRRTSPRLGPHPDNPVAGARRRAHRADAVRRRRRRPRRRAQRPRRDDPLAVVHDHARGPRAAGRREREGVARGRHARLDGSRPRAHRLPLPARRRPRGDDRRQPRRRRPRQSEERRRGRDGGEARVQPADPGVRTARERDAHARDRRVRDLRGSGRTAAAHRLAHADDLARGRTRLRLPVARADAARPRRLAHASRADGAPARAVGASARVVSPARAERARGDREPQRDRRREGSVHRGPFAARAADRARHRSFARPPPLPPGTRSGSPASSTTSASSASRTPCSRSRGR